MNNNVKNNAKAFTGMFSSGIGVMPLYMLISAYLTYFYTNVIGVSAGAVGTIILVSKVFDGISDVIFGNMVDNTKSKLGVCRPWILRCSFLIVVAIVCLFTVPTIGNGGKLVYIFLSYNFSTTIIYTITLVAVLSLPTYITRNTKSQSVMFNLYNVGQSLIATAVSGLTLPLVGKLGGDQKAWILVGAMYGILCMIALLITFILCKEDQELAHLKKEGGKEQQEKYTLLQILKSIVLNKYWIITLAISIVGSSMNTARLTLTSYYAQYVLEDVAKASLINSATTFPGIIACFCCIPLLVKLKKRTALLCSITLIIISSGIVFIDPTSMTILIVSSVIFSFGVSMCVPIASAMLGNVIEYGEWKTGIRSQAALMGANSAGQKIGQGVITAAVSWIMTLSGFDGTAAVQTEAAINSISNLFIFLPIVLTVIQLILTMSYTLDKKYPSIMKDLEERRNKNK